MAAVYAGIHHLAFIAHDVDATIRFWRDLLGMPLAISAGDERFKHFFFRVDDRDMIAFFWWPGAARMDEKAPGVPTTAPRGFDHVAVGVAAKDGFYALRDRLARAGVEYAGPVDHGLTLSLYVTDPNGIAVELAWRQLDVLADLHYDLAPTAAARDPRPPPLRDVDTASLPDVARVAPDAALAQQAIAEGKVRPL